jgi:hypothetical protein
VDTASEAPETAPDALSVPPLLMVDAAITVAAVNAPDVFIDPAVRLPVTVAVPALSPLVTTPVMPDRTPPAVMLFAPAMLPADESDPTVALPLLERVPSEARVPAVKVLATTTLPAVRPLVTPAPLTVSELAVTVLPATVPTAVTF